jgi:putative tricarboxylic transport membrane protein
VITQAEKALKRKTGQERMSAVPPAKTPEDNFLTWREFLPYSRSVLRSSLIGSFIGAMPGIGPAVAAFMAYGAAQRKSKERELFGKGSLEGVSAAEAGNNAVCGAALIPLLTLGIPGDPATAVLLGALMIHDLTPGPLLFQEQTVMVYAMFITLLLSCILLYFSGKAAIRFSRYLTYVPAFFLFPIVMVLCIIGAYAMQNSLFDVWLMLGSGVLGYIMRRFGFPAAPLLIAFLLGGMIENSMRQALLMSRDGYMIFITKPISAVFLAFTVVAVAAIACRRHREHMDKKEAVA